MRRFLSPLWPSESSAGAPDVHGDAAAGSVEADDYPRGPDLPSDDDLDELAAQLDAALAEDDGDGGEESE